MNAPEKPEPQLIDAYPLSPMQQGMLFHSLFTPQDGVYVEQRWCLLEGDLDALAFRKAWQQVVERHAVLRCEFHWQDMAQALQAVYDQVELPWQQDDWQGMTVDGQAQALEQFLAEDRQRGFELDSAPLMRCALFQVDAQCYRFVWTYHHLLMDGWCNGILIKEVMALYAAACRGVALPLPPPSPYRAYIDWLQQRDVQADEDYWRSILSSIDSPAILELGGGNSGSNQAEDDDYQMLDYRLGESLSVALENFAQAQRLTLNTLFQGALALLLGRYAGSDDVLFGATVSGRPPELDGAESLLGLFINTVPVRVNTGKDQLLLNWLQDLQQSQRDREQHGFAPLADLQSLTGVPAGTRLFDALLVFENYPVSMEEALGSADIGLQLSDADGYERTNFPLSLVVIPGQSAGESIALSLRFDAQVLSAAAAQRLCGHLKVLLSGFVDNASQQLADLPLLSDSEQDELSVWEQGPQQAINETPVHQRIAAQARTNPSQTAFIADNGTVLNYAALVAQAEHLARVLISEHNIEPGCRVGVLLERTLQLPLALLAVLKAGAAYVPLARDYPQQRLHYMAKDAGLDLILHDNDSELCEEYFGFEAELFDLGLLAEYSVDATQALPSVGMDGLAYIIYTSGSTGLPKGVPINHGNLANFIDSMSIAPGITPEDVLLAVTTMAFDISVLELFLPLCNGATVVLASTEQTRDASELMNLMAQHKVSMLQASPATWCLLLANNWNGQHGLKMLCGGEALEGALAAQLLERGEQLWNMYGPTETTIWSGAFRVEHRHTQSAVVPVGTPIANTTLRVVDQHQRLVPVGVAGELLIGGAGLSPGYWQRPDLNAERFLLVNGGELQERLYRTGDLVQRREDGLLQFLGRSDFQVKLRGHRIELGEIEASLAEQAAIDQAVVSVINDGAGEPQLVAFLVGNEKLGEESKDTSRLRNSLRERLPDYMLPARFQWLEQLPLTLNGKVDRKALIDLVDANAGESPVAGARSLSPRAELVATAWSDLLGVANISGNDSFFELGGHSLAATRLVTRLAELLQLEVPLRLLFEHPHFDDFIAALETLENNKQQLPAIVKIERGSDLPVSPAQRRQWLLAGLTPDNPMYGILTAVRLQGPLSMDALRASLQCLVERHENLRSYFVEQEGEPVTRIQAIGQGDSITISVDDKALLGLSTEQQARQLQSLIDAETRRPFALSSAPLWRACVFKLDHDHSVLVFTLHHILADGWSMGVLVRELATLYQAFDREKGVIEANPLPALPIQYADYAAWVSELNHDSALDYWQQQLADLPPRLELPTDFQYPAEQSFAGDTYRFSLDAETREGLLNLGRQAGCTLFMTLLCAWGVLLKRVTGIDDIAIGTPVANRTHPDLEGLIGLFVNTLVLRLDMQGDPELTELLGRTRETALAAYQQQQAPFEQVLERLDVERSRSHAPLFQVLFTLQNAPFDAVSVDGIEWSPLSLDTGTAKFDLMLSMTERAHGLDAAIEYRSDLFRNETIENYARLFTQLLQSMPNALEQRLSLLPIIDGDMGRRLQELKTAVVDRPAPADAIHSLFEQQAARTPDAIALEQKQGQEAIRWTYKQLNQRANRLAGLLIERGVKAETTVGLWSQRSVDSLCAIIAILKAGGVYVPLDPDMPDTRLQWLMDDAHIDLVVGAEADEHAVEALPDTQWLWLDQCEDVLVTRSVENVSCSTDRDQLAYILYTSGSTGLPKGVCTPHRGVVRLVSQSAFTHFGEDDTFLLSAPLGFDASTLEIWGPLLNGGRLVLPPVGLKGPLALEQLADLVEGHQVTTLWLTAGLFHLMIDNMPERLASVRQLLAGGDVLSVDHLRRAHSILPKTQLINGYGPTEGTTFTCCHRFSDDELAVDSELSAAPIGKPIAYTDIYVLDETMQPVPIGVPGELYIGGLGLARGYLGQAALTAERFVPNPFVDPSHQLDDAALTLYRSGDRVRLRNDGVVEFLGRFDTQVKVRGFRIEPGEIESALQLHPAIAATAVTTFGDSADTRRLAAYCVADPAFTESLPDKAELRRFLLEQLPVQLVPSSFDWLDALPLTRNGKVDTAALPLPQWSDPSTETEHSDDAVEQSLLAIWSNLLPSSGLNRHSNYFEAGGDSIIALQIVSQASRQGLHITPMQLFQYQTVAELAPVVELDAATKNGDDDLLPAEGELPLTPIQHWFFEQSLASPQHFNQSVALRLPDTVDATRLQTALEQVAQWHDGLRLRFKQDAAGTWQQHYADETGDVTLQPFDLADNPEQAQEAAINEIAAGLHTGLDLANGPLLAVALIERGAPKGRLLLLVAHHLVVDGVSWRILLDDLYQAYQHPGMALGLKTASLRAWSDALTGAVSEATQELDYWRRQVSNALIELPRDDDSQDKSVAARYGGLQSQRIELDTQATQALLQTVPGATGYEPQLLILTALAHTLAHWCQGKGYKGSPTIALENHGRDASALNIALDVSRTLGWFTAIYPFTPEFDHEAEPLAQLASMDSCFNEVPGKGLGYSILRYLGGHQELALQPTVSFNYLGQLDAMATAGDAFVREVSPGPLQAADNLRAQLLDINAWVEGQCLTIEWLYDGDSHSQETIASLTAGMITHLQQLIDASMTGAAEAETSTEFAMSGLDDMGLAAALSQVDFGGQD